MGKIKPLIVLLVCVLVITAVICIVGGIAAGAEGDKTDTEKMREMADLVGDAILSMDNSYKKQVEVVTYPLTYRVSGQHIGITVKDLHFFTQSSRGIIQRNDSVGGVALRLSDGDFSFCIRGSVKSLKSLHCG